MKPKRNPGAEATSTDQSEQVYIEPRIASELETHCGLNIL